MADAGETGPFRSCVRPTGGRGRVHPVTRALDPDGQRRSPGQPGLVARRPAVTVPRKMPFWGNLGQGGQVVAGARVFYALRAVILEWPKARPRWRDIVHGWRLHGKQPPSARARSGRRGTGAAVRCSPSAPPPSAWPWRDTSSTPSSARAISGWTPLT